jgi:hypothetical protein
MIPIIIHDSSFSLREPQADLIGIRESKHMSRYLMTITPGLSPLMRARMIR